MLAIAIPARATSASTAQQRLRSWYRSIYSVPTWRMFLGAIVVPAAILLATKVSGGALGTPSEILLVLLLGTATITDLLWRRIFNWITLPSVLWVVGLTAIASGSGLLTLGAAMSGLGLCLGVMLALYLMFRGGEGDIKLMAGVGGLIGAWHGIEAITFAYILAGLVSAAVIGTRLVRRAKKPWKGVLPMAPFFAAGTVMTLIWK